MPRRASRRLLLQCGAAGTALLAVGATARLGLQRDGDPDLTPPPDGLTLATNAGDDVASLTFALTEDEMRRVAANRWETPRLPTSTHSMIGFTWGLDRRPPELLVRSQQGSAWGSWQRVTLLHDLEESRGQSGLAGADLMWVGRADGVQVRVEGPRPSDLKMVLLHPRPRASDNSPDATSDSTARTMLSRVTPPLRPTLIGRTKWGANGSLRTGSPSYGGTIMQVHIHHTVNSNDYRRADVPALIRGMYAYHTQSLGWSDIGYNFLVDRFGRIFVGRAGGPRRVVVGAHTRGFNSDSTGVAAIGNYDVARPSEAMLSAIAHVAAWKIVPFERGARGRIRVRSSGSDRYPSGRVVRLPVIDGHRDTNYTACPGGHLYDALPQVRRRAARFIANRSI